eukprot:m.1417038 g.1417038  ORF g.1417038 m.1417038 type:complete len:185 (-) comp25032_c2_seq2:232-786(-)
MSEPNGAEAKDAAVPTTSSSASSSSSRKRPADAMNVSFSSSLASLTWLNRLMPSIGSAPTPPPEPKAPPVTREVVQKVDYTQDKDTKPPYAYNLIIYEAIKACDKKKVTLGEIYANIMKKYAYYRARPNETAWKNSIRHNLTVHDCFVKVCLCQNIIAQYVYVSGDRVLRVIQCVLFCLKVGGV